MDSLNRKLRRIEERIGKPLRRPERRPRPGVPPPPPSRPEIRLEGDLRTAAIRYILDRGDTAVYQAMVETGATNEELWKVITATWRGQTIYCQPGYVNITLESHHAVRAHINHPGGILVLGRTELLKLARPMLGIYYPKESESVAEGLFE